MKIWQLEIIRYNIPMRFLLLLLVIPAVGFSSPAEEPPEKTIAILDKAQSFFGSRVNLAANQLDSFFATERADDEFGRSRLRLRGQYFIRDEAEADFKTQYRINLKLPNLQEKFKFKFGKDKEKKKTENNSKVSSEIKPKITHPSQGWIFNADIGVTTAIPPQIVNRARLRRNIETGVLTHRFSEQLTYVTDENGLQEETNLDTDYAISGDVIFRFVNNKRWYITTKDFTTNHGPTLIQRLTDNDALNYGFTTQSIIHSGNWYVSNYRAAINYRKNIYRQWFYMDIIPGIDFPKIRSFVSTPFITFQIEMLFGGT